MKENPTYCYLDGKIVTSDKLFVSGYDIGLLRGYAVYDGITTHNKKPFYLSAHLNRFRKSSLKLGLKIPLTDTKITKIIEALIKKNKYDRTNLRLILSGGQTIDGIEYHANQPTFFILAEKWNPLPKHLYEKGGKLITENHLRFMPEAKTTHYITAVRLQSRRKQAKAVEILFVSNGKVLECSTSNIFMFIDDILITPKNNILLGITRKAVLDIAKGRFKIKERDITMPELMKADEIFITSSFKDIIPIVKIDQKTIGGGMVGKNTWRLMKLFSELTKE
ncbi:MAG: aminotransferase class IV [bacterium]|nr:aminotransferase class IV [bacterium]